MIYTGDEAPTGAVGNLLFTSGGVYANYLLSGMPFIFERAEVQNQVADAHADLWRALPSGTLLEGLTAPVAPRAITRRMIFAHPDLNPDTVGPDRALPAGTDEWVEHCRMWTPTLAQPGRRRRLFWLSLPLDYGLTGATAAGAWQRRLNGLIGRDADSEPSLAAYRELAAAMVAKLPAAVLARPASVEQLWWRWNYLASRHTWVQPLPATPPDPEARLPGSAFTAVYKDQAGAARTGRRPPGLCRPR